MQFLSTKTSIRCIFYSCFNFYLKKKGGGIFDARIKKLISDPVMS